MRFEILNINQLTAAEYAAVLSKQPISEQARLNSLRPDDRKRSLAARFLAEKLAVEVYGRGNFAADFAENGAPQADFCCLSFSHAGEYAACAVADRPVGIDIEPSVSFKKREKYLLFSAAETRFVNKSESPADSFYTLWTMKEAYIKAAGKKLADAAETELVSGGADGVLRSDGSAGKAEPGGILKTGFDGFRFTTRVFENYYIAVCEKLH